MQNPFADLIPGGGGPSLPAEIAGPPREPPPQTPAQAQGDELGNELKRLQLERERSEAAERAQKQQLFQSAQGDAISQLRNVTETVRQAQGLARSSGRAATGIGSITNFMPETPAYNLSALLDTISSNVAFDRLQKMREASPTGGALGAVSERELELLRSTIASLKQGQDPEQFQKGLQKVHDAYERVLFKLPNGFEDAEKRVNEMLRRGATLPQVRKFWQETGREFTADHERKVRAAIRERRQRLSGPGLGLTVTDDSEDIDTILKQYGVQ